MADTITILDGLQFTKPDTADVWTIDAALTECVKTWAIELPPDASGARVIFNAANATASAKYHVRVKCTKLTKLKDDTGPTKTENTQALEWTTVTTPAVTETGAIDVSAAIAAMLHIDAALSSTTAVATGMEIIVQVRKEAALDEWTDWARWMAHTGTGLKADFAAEEAAGQTMLSVTNPATGGLDNIGKHIFIEDTATIAQCEIAFLVSQTGD